MSLLLAIYLLGAGEIFGNSLASAVPPLPTVKPGDGILEINQRLIQEQDPDSDFLMEGDIVRSKSFSMFSPRILQWPKLNGVVTIPYVLSDLYEPGHRAIILDAFKDLESSTCLSFVSRTNQRDYISIQPSEGCFTSVGRTGKKQLLSLSFLCLTKGKGVVLHELMHVAGFWHEHSRADRDLYVSIKWNSIMKGYERNFCKYETTNMIVTYSFDSILHYSSRAFSKDGSLTIVPLDVNYNTEIGQRMRLSPSDSLRINKYYNCPQYTPSEGDHEMLSHDSVVYECPQRSLNEVIGPTEGATAADWSITKSESSSSQQFKISPAPIFSDTHEFKLQATLNGTSQEETTFNTVSTPALNSNMTLPTSSTSSQNLSTRMPITWPAISMAVSTISELQLSVGDAWNTELKGVTGFTKIGHILKLSNQPAESGSVNEELKKHSTTKWMRRKEGVPLTKDTLEFDHRTTIPESKRIKETLTNDSIQNIDQLPNQTHITLVSNPPVTSPPEVRVGTSDKWTVPMKTSLYSGFKHNFTKEEKESIENTKGIYLSTKTSGSTTVLTTVLEGSLTSAISQITEKGTIQNIKIKDHTTLKTPASSQRTPAPEQAINGHQQNSSGQEDVFNTLGDPDYAHLNKEVLKMEKRSLPELLFVSKLGKSNCSRTECYVRWIHANPLTPPYTDTKKGLVHTLGNGVKQSRSVLRNLFSQKKGSTIWRMPYLGRSLEVKTKSETVCGFEHGLCGWKQSINNDFNWSFSLGSLNPYTGYFIPRGFHLSLKSSPRGVSIEQKALLLSPITETSSCVSFWYGSRHRIMGTMNVYVLSSTGEKTLLWSTAGQDPIGWTKAQIKLPPHPRPDDLQVVVEGKTRQSDESNIVIDNLHVGKCS